MAAVRHIKTRQPAGDPIFVLRIKCVKVFTIMKTVRFVLPLFAVTIHTAVVLASESLTSEIFYELAQRNAHQNFVISPASIHTSLALLLVGAKDKTAAELKSVLNMITGDLIGDGSDLKNKMIVQFLLGSPLVEVVARLFVDRRYSLAPSFNRTATDYLKSGAEDVVFADQNATAHRINAWVYQQTRHNIERVVDPSSFDAEYSALLVNTIYFEGKWIRWFKTAGKHPFHLNSTNTVEAEMMKNFHSHFGYAVLDDLNATALSVHYDLSMIKLLIILPNSVDGLDALERKLQHVKLTDVMEQLEADYVDVVLPKFKITSNTPLNELLKQLGVKSVFRPVEANLGGATVHRSNLHVNSVLHDVFFEVNEEGTDVNDVLGPEHVLKPPMKRRKFFADHPFFFAVMEEDTVYFTGHVVKV